MFALIVQAVMLAVVVFFYILTCRKMGEARDYVRSIFSDVMKLAADISNDLSSARRIASRIVTEDRDIKGFCETAYTQARAACDIARKLIADAETVEKRTYGNLERSQRYAADVDRARQLVGAMKDTAQFYAVEAKAAAQAMREVKPAPAPPSSMSVEDIRAAVQKVREKYSSGYDTILEYVKNAYVEHAPTTAMPYLDTIAAIAQSCLDRENAAKS